jgi:hypothetical protein
VAKVKESIANIVDTTPDYTEKNVESVVNDVVDIPSNNVSDDDDAWVDSILNG